VGVQISRQNDIWVLAPWSGTENTIRGKVVDSPKFGLWWVMGVRVCSWFVRAPKLLQLCINHVTTLALGSWPRRWFVRLWAKRKLGSHISCSQECKRVRGNEPSHSQVNSHFGIWSPNGFPNFQKAIAKVKTHWIEEFFVSLGSYGNINVQKWARMTHLDI
jgi:hypothetical protein